MARYEIFDSIEFILVRIAFSFKEKDVIRQVFWEKSRVRVAFGHLALNAFTLSEPFPLFEHDHHYEQSVPK